MKNMVFVIWMLGYALIAQMHEWNPYQNYTHEGEVAWFLVSFVVWIVVGYLLYEKKGK